VGDVRDYFARLGGSVRLSAWWNGASLDRLLDERHASVIEALIGEMHRHQWPSETD